MPGRRLQAVAETRAFSDDIDAMLSEADRDAVIVAIAAAPEGGDLIRGTGGLRKRRVALPGRGKRGGARAITLFLGEEWPRVYATIQRLGLKVEELLDAAADPSPSNAPRPNDAEEKRQP